MDTQEHPLESAHVRHLYQAIKLAREYVRMTIESECHSHTENNTSAGTVRWYDTWSLTSAHEHAPQVIDLNTELLRWGLESGLLAQHLHTPRYVRIIHKP